MNPFYYYADRQESADRPDTTASQRRIDRRHFISVLTTLTLVGSIRKALGAAPSPSEIRGVIVDKARGYVGTTDWAHRSGYGFINDAYFCNIFVAHVCREANAATWEKVVDEPGHSKPRDPLAREWENPHFKIKGWEVVYHATKLPALKEYSEIFALRHAGDVLSGGGHMGIVSDEGKPGRLLVISAASEMVVKNDWGARLPRTKNYSSAAEWKKEADKYAAKFTARRFVGA